jgi:hypothetical protein
MNKGIATVLAAGTLVLAACNGWPTTLPYQQAVMKPEKYTTYSPAAAEAVPMFYAGNHRFMVLPGESNVRGARTSSVNSGGQVSVFALEGDAAPFGNLFTTSAGGRVHAAALID